ncbi:MAG: AAA family ATPase [Cyanobacteriota bacterium]
MKHPPANNPLSDSPYKGLNPYEERDSEIFFGREQEIQEVVNNLLAWRLTVLYGKSGVGKSSLLRAGVTHLIREEAQRNVEELGTPKLAVVVFPDREREFSWRDDPLANLLGHIEQSLTAMRERFAEQGREIQSPPASSDLLSMLQGWTKALGDEQSDGNLYIILDQLEEYFLYHSSTLDSPAIAVDSFFTAFCHAANTPSLRVNFLLSLREDAYTNLDRFSPWIPHLFDHRLSIGPLTGEAGEKAIKCPLLHYNALHNASVEIEQALVDEVLSEVQVGRVVLGQAGLGGVQVSPRAKADMQIETPYLQLVLKRLWDEEMGRNHSHKLRLETFGQLGRAQQIIKDHLQVQMQQMDHLQQYLAASIFQYLVSPTGTKYAYSIEDLASDLKVNPDQIQPLLEYLAKGDQRIVRPVDRAIPAHPERQRYEIFHDALAPAVLQWRDNFLKDQEKQELVEKQKKAEETRLIEQEKLSLERQGRAVRRERRYTYGLLALVSIFFLGIVDACQRLDKGNTGLEAESALVEWKRGSSQLQALLNAMRLKESPASLLALQVILDDIRQRQEWSLPGERTVASARSPDGRFMVFATDTWGLYFSDGSNQPRQLKVQYQTQANSTLQFGPINSLALGNLHSGEIALAIRRSKQGRPEEPRDHLSVWNVRVPASGQAGDPNIPWILSQPRAGFEVESLVNTQPFSGRNSIALSPDGSLIAYVNKVNGIGIKDLQTEQLVLSSPQDLNVKPSDVLLRFSPDGQSMIRVIATGEFLAPGEPIVTIWSSAGVKIDEWTVPIPQTVSSLDVSRDSGKLALSGLVPGAETMEGVASVWSFDGKPTGQVSIHGTGIASVAFSPDSKFLATGLFDSRLAIWQQASFTVEGVSTYDQKFVLPVQQGPVIGVAFADDQGQEKQRKWALNVLSLRSSWSRWDYLNTWQRKVNEYQQSRYVCDLITNIIPIEAPVSIVFATFRGLPGLFIPPDGFIQPKPSKLEADCQQPVSGKQDPHQSAGNKHRQAVRAPAAPHVVVDKSGRYAAIGSNPLAGTPGRLSLWELSTSDARESWKPLFSKEQTDEVVVGFRDKKLITARVARVGKRNRQIIIQNYLTSVFAKFEPPLSLELVKPVQPVAKTNLNTIVFADATPSASLISLAFSDGQVYVMRPGPHASPLYQQNYQSVSKVRLAPDGKHLGVVSTNGTIEIVPLRPWPFNQPHRIKTRLSVSNIAFSPDSQRMLIASRDGKVSLWNLKGEQLAQYSTSLGLVDAVFSPDGKSIVGFGWPGKFVHWPLSELASDSISKNWEKLKTSGCNWLQHSQFSCSSGVKRKDP